MEIHIYLSFGLIILILLRKEINGAEYDCKYHIGRADVVTCRKSKSDELNIPQDLHKNLTQMNIYNEDDALPWVINSVDCFRTYPQLEEISLTGPMTFSPELQTQSKKKELREKLFSMPNLKSLHLLHNNFNTKDHMWKLPNGIFDLLFVNNTYTTFNLENCRELRSLEIVDDKMEIPSFSYPPPPLEHFALFKLSTTKVSSPRLPTANVIAVFCKLKHLGVSITDDLLGTPDASCHCIKLKEWVEELKIIIEWHGEDKKTPWNCVQSDCSGYSLEEARKKRQMCSTNSFPSTTIAPSTAKPTSISKTLIITIASILLGLSVILAITLFIIGKLTKGVEQSSAATVTEEEIEEELEEEIEEVAE